jgi:hemerythrin-like metal-binding protein
MKTIDWHAGFSVGVRSLDEQHKKIVDAINLLGSQINAGVDSEIVSDILTVLTKYAMDHFRDEERLLKENGYPKLANQIREHTLYKKTIVDLCQNATDHEQSVPADILSFLQQWWVHHILEEDMGYRQFLSERGAT